MRQNNAWPGLALSLAMTACAVLQAIAINQVDGLLPDWLGNLNSVVGWVLVFVTTAMTFCLAAYATKRAKDSVSAEIRDGLSVRTSFGNQSTLSLHELDPSVIRWTTSFEIWYTGPEVITVQDLIPTFPKFETENGEEIQVVRTKRDHIYSIYPSLGAMAAAEDRGDPYEHHDEWPLVLQPGRRVVVSIRQELAMLLDNAPIAFDRDDVFLQVVGVYFQLEPYEDSFRVGERDIPTRIVCDHEEWVVDVPYLIMPVGGVIEIPELPTTDSLD